MAHIKRYLLVAGALLLAGIVALILTPKAVHAVTAILVQVMNTPANPVPNRDVDRAADEPFAVTLCNGSTNFNCFFQEPSPEPSSFVVPSTTTDGKTVQEVVIEYIDGQCNALPSSVQGIYLYGGAFKNFVQGTAVNFPHFIPTVANTGTFPGVSWSTPASIYLDPGSTVSFLPSINGFFACSINLTGHITTQ
jgi:hypothetical protein